MCMTTHAREPTVSFPCLLIGGAAGGVLLLIGSVTLFLKLVSWAHVHHDLRLADRESAEHPDADLDSRVGMCMHRHMCTCMCTCICMWSTQTVVAKCAHPRATD